MKNENRTQGIYTGMCAGIILMLEVSAWGDPKAGISPPAEPAVLSALSHPTLSPLRVLRRNPRNSYMRQNTAIAIFIDDQDRPLTPKERQRVQEAFDQLPADALAGLPSIYVRKDRTTRGFLSPLNGTDLAIAFEDSGEHSEGPFALRHALVTAVGQYVYAHRLTVRERAEWKAWHAHRPLSEQVLREDFAADYAAYALDSRQFLQSAIRSSSDRADSPRALERALFIAASFVEPGAPSAGLRFYKTYDTGATDIPWPPQVAVRDRTHVRVGPFFFQLNGRRITGWNCAMNSREAAWMNDEGIHRPGFYRRFSESIPLPQATFDRIPAS